MNSIYSTWIEIDCALCTISGSFICAACTIVPGILFNLHKWQPWPDPCFSALSPIKKRLYTILVVFCAIFTKTGCVPFSWLYTYTYKGVLCIKTMWDPLFCVYYAIIVYIRINSMYNVYISMKIEGVQCNRGKNPLYLWIYPVLWIFSMVKLPVYIIWIYSYMTIHICVSCSVLCIVVCLR